MLRNGKEIDTTGARSVTVGLQVIRGYLFASLITICKCMCAKLAFS